MVIAWFCHGQWSLISLVFKEKRANPVDFVPNLCSPIPIRHGPNLLAVILGPNLPLYSHKKSNRVLLTTLYSVTNSIRAIPWGLQYYNSPKMVQLAWTKYPHKLASSWDQQVLKNEDKIWAK